MEAVVARQQFMKALKDSEERKELERRLLRVETQLDAIMKQTAKADG
jgi:hypothetical protein